MWLHPWAGRRLDFHERTSGTDDMVDRTRASNRNQSEGRQVLAGPKSWLSEMLLFRVRGRAPWAWTVRTRTSSRSAS